MFFVEQTYPSTNSISISLQQQNDMRIGCLPRRLQPIDNSKSP